MSDQGVAGPHESVDYRVTNGWTVVEANEEIDIAFAPLVQAAVIRRLAEGHRHFVLDLCGTSFLDSMGLGMIVAVTKRIKTCHGSLRIACFDDGSCMSSFSAVCVTFTRSTTPSSRPSRSPPV